MTAKPRVALFIDCENASPAHVLHFMEHARSLGRVASARCYGNADALKRWSAEIAAHHLVPMLTPPGAGKANASDFALTIDAVALLHRDMFDHAVITSSDSDFTLLALHIREHGKGIDGIGEAKAKTSLRSVFQQFIVIPAAIEAAKPTPAPAKAAAQDAKPKAPAAKPPPPAKKATPAVKPSVIKPIDSNWLRSVFDEVRKSSDHCDKQALARALAGRNKDYKKGFRTLDNYLDKSGLFRVDGQKVSLKA